MKFTDVVSKVIDLAKKANAARAQRASTLPGFPMVTSGVYPQAVLIPGQPDLIPIPPGPPEERALLDFLLSQSPEAIYLLTALMYLGRGDYEADRLFDNCAIMGERFGGPRWAAGLMADKMVLPDLLERGLRKANQANLDLDAAVMAAA